VRLRNLYGIVLVLGLGLVSLPGQVPGQGAATPPAWAPSGNEPAGAAPGQPIVIATTRSHKGELPPDSRLPLPDDGLPTRPTQATPTAPARPTVPPPAGPIQQTGFVNGAGPSSNPPPVPRPGALPSSPLDATTWPVREAADRDHPPGSAISLEVVGPNRAVPGQVYPCVVVVRNVSRVILADVRIELPLPPGSRPMLPSPVTAKRIDSLDSTLTWEIGNLQAGAERRLTADFRVADAGEIHLRPRASFSTAVGLRASVVRPPFSIDVTGPWKALPGEKITFKIRVGNNTQAALRLVQIRCKLGAGLWHAQGDLVETDLAGGLAPGEQRQIELTIEARGTGGLTLAVSGTADGRLTAQADALVDVSEQALVARLNGPRTALLGNEVAFRLEVDNPGRATATGLRLRQVLPQGLEFVSADSSAHFDAASHAVTWVLSELPAGQRRSVTFQVRAKQVGDWALLPAVLADNAASSTAPHAVHVEPAPTLALEVSGLDEALGAGRETTCEVRVSNQATAPAHAVRLVVQLPDNLGLVDSTGPSQPRAQGQILLFDPLPELRGRAVAVYRLRVRGQRPGAGLFRVEVQAEGMTSPVQRERTSRVDGPTPAPTGG
jgi:uncharacterized repeat protein (TIGR01451 family)